jgi:predicted GIY-YIG superfamily endonuclease
MKQYYIYILYDNLLQRYFYIGCSYNLKSRYWQHKRTFGNTITLEIIHPIITTKKNAHKAEKYWINQFSAWGFAIHNTNCNSTRIVKNYKSA